MKEIIAPESKALIQKENGFDLIRYYLALVVVFAHFSILSDTSFHWFTSSEEAVYGFFILSGFLVYYSFIERPDCKIYFQRRGKRILPPYFFIVCLCLVMGILLTDLSVKDYLTSAHFYRYVAANFSFLNFMEPTLPGVFTRNTLQAVNGSLWTLKIELLLYLTVPLTYYFFKRYNKATVLLSIFLFSILYRETFDLLYQQNPLPIYRILERQVGGQLIYFYSGTAILLYFKSFQRYIGYLFPLALIVYIFRNECTLLEHLSPLAFAILIIGLAYNCKYLNFLYRRDNISYGIYLFHFPVIQVIVHYHIHQYSTALALFLTLAFTIALAYFSWVTIEKPFCRRVTSKQKG